MGGGVGGEGLKGEGKRESRADSMLSTESTVGLSLMALRS